MRRGRRGDIALSGRASNAGGNLSRVSSHTAASIVEAARKSHKSSAAGRTVLHALCGDARTDVKRETEHLRPAHLVFARMRLVDGPPPIQSNRESHKAAALLREVRT